MRVIELTVMMGYKYPKLSSGASFLQRVLVFGQIGRVCDFGRDVNGAVEERGGGLIPHLLFLAFHAFSHAC